MVLLAAAAFTRTDPDLWGHTLFGMDILRDLTIPTHDPYSFTSDRSWINHEWAAEVITGGVFKLLGNAGLVLTKLAVVSGFLMLLMAALRYQAVEQAPTRDYLAGVAVITTVQQAHHLRPQIFSLLFFAVLLTCLIRAQRDKRWLSGLPPLFAAWANFHGGWIVGGAVLVLWTTGLFVKRTRDALWHIAAGAASLLATLANPYGTGLWRFLRETVGFGRADITDWQPIYGLDVSVWGLWIVTAAVAVAGLLHGRWMTIGFERLLVVVALAIASVRVNRLLGFFALATLFLLSPAIAQAFQRKNGRAVRPSPPLARGAAVGVLTLIAAAAVILMVKLACVQVDARTTPPPGAVAFLKTQAPGRLLVWFDWGEYAIWHLAPHFLVSIDGRRETVYSAALQQRHLRFFFDAPGGASLPAELGADYVWIPRQLPAARRLQSSAWRQAYSDAESLIFIRTHGPGSGSDRQGVSSRRCFPGP